MIHCCNQMRDHCEDSRVQIYYLPVFREYYIALRGNQAKQLIKHCPWCAKRVPSSVRDEYYRILDDKELDNPPEDFQSEDWWIKRNL